VSPRYIYLLCIELIKHCQRAKSIDKGHQILAELCKWDFVNAN